MHQFPESKCKTGSWLNRLSAGFKQVSNQKGFSQQQTFATKLSGKPGL